MAFLGVFAGLSAPRWPLLVPMGSFYPQMAFFYPKSAFFWAVLPLKEPFLVLFGVFLPQNGLFEGISVPSGPLWGRFSQNMAFIGAFWPLSAP